MEITLPQWLDNLIYNELKAQYCPRRCTMTNIDDNMEESLNYLGTYFPRSYAEAYCIFSDYFQQHNSEFANQEELSIFDFCCGTGGEIIGLLTVLEERFPTLKKVRIVALDGNQHALLLYEKVLSVFQQRTRIQIENRPTHLHINFYKLEMLDTIMTEQFDLIVSCKAIGEFVTKQQFEDKNPYGHIAKFLFPKLKNNGLLLLEDITNKNDVSQQWLPNMLDEGLNEAHCAATYKNEGYNQIYFITHSHWQNDGQPVAWRMIKR